MTMLISKTECNVNSCAKRWFLKWNVLEKEQPLHKDEVGGAGVSQISLKQGKTGSGVCLWTFLLRNTAQVWDMRSYFCFSGRLLGVGEGCDTEWKCPTFFFFFCWSRILLLLLYNRYRNLNLKPFQLRLILSLLVVSDAVDDRRRHYHKSAELTMIFRSPPESGWQSPQLGTLSITITFYIKCS